MSQHQITVAVPTHPKRLHNGLLGRALGSVARQIHPAAAMAVAVDTERRGAAFTRQRALDMVQTEWVAFLDSDDELLPEHLGVLARAQRRSGADFVYSWYEIVGGADPLPVTHFTEPWNDDQPRATTVTVMVRTELARVVGYWREGDGLPKPDEDWRFTLGCLAAGARIYHVPRRTWRWYHHGMNTSGQPGRGDAT